MQLNNHVDDGLLDDWSFERLRGQTYRVHFHLQGTIGDAIIHIVGDKMDWKLLHKQPNAEDEPNDWSVSPPVSARLVRLPPNKVRHPPSCKE